MKEDKLPFPEMEAKNLVLFNENITKSEIQQKAIDTIESVNEGHVNSIEVYTQVRAVHEVTKAIMDGIKKTTINDVESLNPKERNFRGIKLELANGRTKYDFSHDNEWTLLNEQLSEIKEKIKDREKLMIQANDYAGVSDKDGVEIVPAVIIGGTEQSLKVVIPK